jgi:glycosyltransferase involved in cell wall biosynthesis
MIKKKTIIYIIDSLERGGAEVMLVSTLKEISKFYNIIIVTLHPQNVFTREELIYDKIYCLDTRNKKNIFSSAKTLKKIISDNNVDIVHSTLFWSVIVARLACGKKTPHIFSLATVMSSGIYKHKWYSGYTKILDHLTYKKDQVVISPTKEVLRDFDKAIGIKGKNKVLYNFVNEEFFLNEIDYKKPADNLRLVAVGNLKDVKNYQLLIDAFKSLKEINASIDIYGEGPDRHFLQKQITEFDLAINLMGLHDRIYEVLPSYDAFVMCSFIEGFGIAAAEAMSIGLPLILSDITTLREISQNNALFFNPCDPQSFVKVISKTINGETDLKKLSENGKKISRENYTKEKYLKSLLKYYDEILN